MVLTTVQPKLRVLWPETYVNVNCPNKFRG